MAGTEIKLTGTPTGAILEAAGSSWTLSADEIDRMISVLAAHRLNASPAVPNKLPLETVGLPVSDPAWRAGRDVMSGGAVVSLRHPGLSWVNFSFPPDEARSLAKTLLEIADAKDDVSRPN